MAAPTASAPINCAVFCRFSLKQFEGAHADCDEWVKLDPKCAAAYYRRARCGTIFHRYPEALADCNESLRLHPGDGEVLALRSDLHRFLGRDDLARADATAALKAGYRSDGLFYQRGKFYYQQGKFEAALRDLNAAIGMGAKDAHSFCMRALVHLALEKGDKARADFRESQRLSGVFFPDAIVEFLSGDPAEIRAVTKRWHKAFPEGKARDAFFYLVRSQLRVLDDTWESGVADCDRALELDPTCVAARRFRAAYYLRLDEIEKAIADCDAALKQEPLLVDCLGLRSEAYLKKGSFLAALCDLAEAIFLDPSYVRVRVEIKP